MLTKPGAASGASLGIKAGVVLSVAYILLINITLADQSNLVNPTIINVIRNSSNLLLIEILVGTIIGSVLGLICGSFVDFIFSGFEQAPSTRKIIFAGVSVPALLLVVLYLLLSKSLLALWSMCDVNSFFQVFGFPGLLCISTGIWASIELNNQFRHFLQVQTTIENTGKHWPDFIVETIKSRHHTASRYEIDLALIQAGQKPSEIEMVWQNLEAGKLSSNDNVPLSSYSRPNYKLTVLAILALLLLEDFLVVLNLQPGWFFVVGALLVAVGLRKKQPLISVVLVLSTALLLAMLWLAQFHTGCTFGIYD